MGGWLKVERLRWLSISRLAVRARTTWPCCRKMLIQVRNRPGIMIRSQHIDERALYEARKLAINNDDAQFQHERKKLCELTELAPSNLWGYPGPFPIESAS